MNEVRIGGLSLDSRHVKAGDLFVAMSGTQQDGRQYINAAIEKGAVAVLTEPQTSINNELSNSLVPIIEFPNLKACISHIAGRFFSEPSRHMNVIGITGTNGKTSCSHFIAQLLSDVHQSCGIIGTLGTGLIDSLKVSDCTTPNPILTQQQLAELRAAGASTVAMEVTSHALSQGRVEGIQFHTAIFTNLTRDHLDYHGEMSTYFAAKRRLFLDLNSKYLIINLDDYYGRQLIRDAFAAGHKRIVGFTTYLSLYTIPLAPDETLEGLQEIIPSLMTTEALLLNTTGMQATVHTPWGSGKLQCPILGRFNFSNSLAALAAVCVQDVPFEQAREAIKTLKTVPGRMMHLGGTQPEPLVVIDYSHTPDALMQVLIALRAHCHGKLWCVFGCGGDRDRGKRPQMAEIAEKYSDIIVVTQDNPRTENPQTILDDILQGIQNLKTLYIEPNRKLAIQLAIEKASFKDIILIAGKGHEEYQIIGTEKIPLSDQAEALKALMRRNG
jgi:UDP-N-acetylmuramoyl-L-alanyl-D-glutamate--2,6-diaminopimelate ligase